MRLRADMLHSCLLLLSCLATIRTCPPPAIAPAVAQTLGQELLRCGHMATEVRATSRLGKLDMGSHKKKIFLKG